MTRSSTNPPPNPWPKRLGIALAAIVGLALIVWIALILWLRSDSGRTFVETTVEDLEIAGQRIALDGLDGSVLGQFELDRIELTGPDGVWLVASDVTIDWNPRTILSGTVDVNSLRVGDLDVLSRPVLIPGDSDGQSRVDTFDIDGIALPDVSLAEAVAGQAMALSAQGDLRHAPDGGDARLSARSDAGDTVEADLQWSPLLVLSGEATVEGAPGGLIAGLLRLGPDKGVTADVTTRDSQTNVLARIDGMDFADIVIERTQSRIDMTGRVTPGPLPLLDRVAPFLGGETEFDATLPLDQDAKASIDLRAPLLTLSAAGARRDGDIYLDTLALEATDPLASFDRDDVAIGRLIARGQAVIGDNYRFEGQLDVLDIDYQAYRVDRLQGPATLIYDEGNIRFDTALTGQAATSAAARANGARIDAAGQYDIDARALTLDRADVALPGLSFKGAGTVVAGGEGARTNLSGRYKVDTSLFRDGPAAILTGQADIRTTPQGPVAELSGRARNITGLASAVQPLVPGGLDYTARVRFEDGGMIVPRFTARNDRLQADGSGRYSDGNLSATIDYAVDRYDFAAVSATGIEGQATLSGPLQAIAFETDARMRTLDTGQLKTTDATASATGTYAGGVIDLSGDLAGDSAQGRIVTRGDVTLEDGNWTVTNIDGSLGGLSATGSLSGIGGSIAAIRGDMVISGTSPLVPADSVEARLLLNEAQVDVEAVLSGLNYWRLQDADVTISAKGPRESVAFDVAAEGRTEIRDITRNFVFAATGIADLSAQNLSGQTDFDIALGDLTLVGNATVRHSEQGWAGIVNADGLGGTLQAALDPGEDIMAFDLDTVSVPQLARLLARPATEGTVSGTGRFQLVPEGVSGQAEFTLDDLRSPISDSEPVSVMTRLSLQDERLVAILEATEGGLAGQARIEGAVDTLSRAPYLVWPPAVPLAGQADLRGAIGPLAEVFLPPQTDVAGQIQSDLTFTLPSTPTGLQGRIELSDGAFEQGALGLRFNKIEMVADLSGETITIPSISAKGVDGGTLNGSGRMGLGEGTGTVDIRADKLKVIDRREGNAEVSGELSVSRTTELLRLSGELRVTDAYLNIARLPKPGLPTLEIDFGDDEDEEETRSFASATTEMDIRIVSAGRIRVRGRGLNASMSLDAAVRGAFDNPVATGEMSIARGRFDFLGKRFEFRDSNVFIRDDIMKSILSLEAIRRTSDLTAVVKVSGTLDRPEIELTSEPNLPEDEVLSRILFGRSPTQLSAIETARLAAALAQLSGGSGFDLFGSLENAVGLDTLEVGQNETGLTQLTTGKYLSDDVYLEVRTTSEGTPGIAVEWQVRDNVSLEAETVPNERERLSVQWRKDFD